MSDIVLVHGTTQSPAGFARLVDTLEAAGQRAICVNVPSGAASSSAGYSDLLVPFRNLSHLSHFR